MNAADRTGAGEPTVSVIIPVYNDPEGVRVTLESVLDQTYSKTNYEVLAVDNNSDDGTQSVIKTFRSTHPEVVRLTVEDKSQGPAAARNAGIREARGSLFAFIDADMTVDETWLESVVTSMTENDWDYMGCHVEIYYEEGKETLAAKYNKAFGFSMERNVSEEGFVGTGCLVVTRRLIDEIGPFSEQLRFAGDVEFGRRVRGAGFNLHFQPDITMYHPARSSFSAMLEKGFRTGRGQIHLHNHHPNRIDVRSHLNPRNYLPPHPGKMYERITNELSPPVKELVALYGLSYLNKLARSTGKIYERIVG